MVVRTEWAAGDVERRGCERDVRVSSSTSIDFTVRGGRVSGDLQAELKYTHDLLMRFYTMAFSVDSMYKQHISITF